MFDKLKRRLYYEKFNLLYIAGIQDGRIVEFDDEFYSKMKDTYVSGIPVSINLRYLKPKISPGKCYDRSLAMFFCFPDALLVRADDKDLEYRFGKENAGHGWIEMDNYVYDPSLLSRFDKDLYYEIFKPYNVTKIDKDTYNKTTDGYYDQVTSITKKDYMPGGKCRHELAVIGPLIEGIANLSSDENFKKEVSEYFELIQYDYEEIENDIQNKMNQIMGRR